MKTVIGKVWNERKSKFQAVTGYEFSDSPGYYEFYEVRSKDHFRKRPTSHDSIQEVDNEIFDYFNDL